MYPNANQYRTQQIVNASPAQQVVMMYDGAIKFTQQAKEAIEQGEIQARHNANKRAMEVVSYMMDILDMDKGGDVAKRLQLIYTFLLRRMLEIDFKNDPRICDEVTEHLRTLRASWEKIAKTEGIPAGTGNQSTAQRGTEPQVRNAVA